MKELIYQVEFLSDIVLPSTSNNEGNISQLDFIPGSNFLGMVASRYSEFKDSFNIFHSGAVKFGDATILKEGKPTYKMPLSYFHKKLDDKVIYNHHLIKEDEFKCLGQLKQLRNGYITKDKEVVNIQYNYSQKSAYDRDNRRSLEGSMFGYSAMQSGTVWQFSIKIKDTITLDDLELLKKSIIGKKRLGKSKSAQYGLVEIKQIGQTQNIEEKNSTKLVLYANSRLALTTECGNPTYDLKYLFEGLKDENIDYSKCQIRTSTFTPYNKVRQTKDYQRVCINKGSVIVLKDISHNKIPNFVGAYLSEGFGELLVNPSFLDEYSLELKKEFTTEDKKEELVNTQIISKFLQQKEAMKKEKLDLGKEVFDFIDKNKNSYSKKMNAQWGAIRSLCSKESSTTIYKAVEEYISKGVAQAKWEGSKRSLLLTAIKESENALEFTKLLSMQMPKIKENKEQSDEK
ncbi:MAG: hypothetical protein WC141_05095 [Arcobacteraceae bacterium]